MVGMQPRSIHLTVWEEMQGWLENLELAFPERRMPLREWLPILESGMASLTVGVIPPALDQVLIGTIDRSRNPELKLAIVLGVNEGVFPAPPAPPTILTEAERSRLALEELPLGISARRYLGHERYYGYIAFSRATERLVVAWSATDAEGRPLNPSPFIGQLQRMFPESEMGDFSGAAAWWQAEHVSDLAGPLVQSRAAGSAGAAAAVPAAAQVPEWLVARWARLPSLGELDERCRVLQETGAPTTLSPDLAERLYGTRLTTSVSALEDFAACPFKFFVARGLEAKERELFETDVRERGSFQHELLERFHAEVRRSGRRWRDLAPIEAAALIERLGGELMGQYRGGLFERSSEAAYLGRHMTARVAQMLGALVKWMAQYRFDPVAVELAFGMDAAGLPGWRLALDEQHALYLRGRIDRVDVCATGDTAAPLAVVIDYKSSHKTLLPIRLEHGLQLQLLSYLGVLRNSPDLTRTLGVDRVEPIGVFYISMRPERLSTESRAEGLEKAEEAAAVSYRHQGRFDRSFLSYLDTRGVSKGDQFVYSKNKDGEFSVRGNQALASETFRQLESQVEERLRTFGRRIYQGQIEAAPYQIKKERACEFCEFRSVCRFDPWTGGFRVLREGGTS